MRLCVHVYVDYKLAIYLFLYTNMNEEKAVLLKVSK